jgi:hypothetical protein
MMPVYLPTRRPQRFEIEFLFALFSVIFYEIHVASTDPQALMLARVFLGFTLIVSVLWLPAPEFVQRFVEERLLGRVD